VHDGSEEKFRASQRWNDCHYAMPMRSPFKRRDDLGRSMRVKGLEVEVGGCGGGGGGGVGAGGGGG
jgi:hypothetical protein